ncbi:hypothetical protein JH265_22500 (plasmid) [Xanthomonas campestris pv. campestris]|uniref:hypothetical protein n=1 Tax=Xanthomonas campestris TaxID=339 RepID=UPI0023681D86|nr:hypothetical protein [Xanthomonas campestris]MEB1409476.1 hypothetical protein [Xanthomonas campestris pv. campestris]MEB1510922.1 hypothetical protein [Xanthomonas campestris pv. campestris]MEB1763488.1 hypothetical protein [Xanthomonas campestris pv. campestris]MEB1874170.1 hypothetical protein [Xanthomonas campestris pv. campestris]MEB1909938.1 hypothetical protein [Xanthomonas campestris pv. campestris]
MTEEVPAKKIQATRVDVTPAPTRRKAIAGVARLARIVYLGDLGEIRRTHAYFRDRLQRVLHQGRYARNETFEEAQARLGLTPQDIARRAAELRSQSLLYLGVAGVALFVFLLLPLVSNPISHAAMSLLVMVLALSKYSVSRWRQGQCEERNLVPYMSYWLRWWRS